MHIDVNCDLGESFGIWKLADDSAIMDHISTANIACGFHASDPGTMAATVSLAARRGIAMGAHPGLPDLWGFGRRAMVMPPEEVESLVRYQVGALTGFLDASGATLNHIKPHGSLYGMAARDEETAEAVTRVAYQYGVPVFGMRGTAQEAAAEKMGVAFISEFFADLDYDDDGGLIITRDRGPLDLAAVAAKIRQAVLDGTVTSVNGVTLQVELETVCFHSDTPNSLALAETVSSTIREIEEETTNE